MWDHLALEITSWSYDDVLQLLSHYVQGSFQSNFWVQGILKRKSHSFHFGIKRNERKEK